jgi:hypothetical protein
MEKTVERIYKRILHEIVEPITGKGVTYDDDLWEIGKDLLGPKFHGVYSSNNTPTTKNIYYIINVDKSTEPGSHWLGCVNQNNRTYIYDSFGRKTAKLIPHLGGKITDADYDKEQKNNEDNCGARCLAWLLVVKHLGVKNALKI